MSTNEQACLFEFEPEKKQVKAAEPGEFRYQPTFSEDEVLARYEVGEVLTVLGRITAPGRHDQNWSVVRWQESETGEPRNVFVHGLDDDEVDLVERGRFRDCAVCPEMVVVPAGSFMMGSPSDEKGRRTSENPRHRVRLWQRFAVGAYEVTFEEWDACVHGNVWEWVADCWHDSYEGAPLTAAPGRKTSVTGVWRAAAPGTANRRYFAPPIALWQDRHPEQSHRVPYCPDACRWPGEEMSMLKERFAVVAACLLLAASAAQGQGGGGLQENLKDVAARVAKVLNEEAVRQGQRLQVTFRPAYTEPSGVRIYCRALSHGLRNALQEAVAAQRDNWALNFDLASRTPAVSRRRT